MKPKANRKTDLHASQPMDRCYTPAYALDPLLPYLRKEWVIWEPAAGDGHMVRALESAGLKVIASEVQTGQNFFTYQPDHFDCIVTNPPYSIKADWLGRCYQLGKPFALLIPVETVGMKAAQRHMQAYGAEFNWLDKRVNFIMPNKGLGGGGAQFPVYWHTFQITGQPVNYWKINRRADVQPYLLEVAA